MKENGVFTLRKPVEGMIIGEKKSIILQVGQSVTVVLVHGNESKPSAYEVESYLAEIDSYVLATIDANDI